MTFKTFGDALKQIKEVKNFVSSRKKRNIKTIDPYLSPLKMNIKCTDDYPKIRNPVYCGIIFRKTDLDVDEIKKLKEEFNDSQKNEYNPETIIFSKNDYMQIGYDDHGFQPTLFLLKDKNISYEYVRTKGDLAFGMCLMNLIAAINWIRLGNIDWINVLNHYIQNKVHDDS